jgi:hypothetical protein
VKSGENLTEAQSSQRKHPNRQQIYANGRKYVGRAETSSRKLGKNKKEDGEIQRR